MPPPSVRIQTGAPRLRRAAGAPFRLALVGLVLLLLAAVVAQAFVLPSPARLPRPAAAFSSPLWTRTNTKPSLLTRPSSSSFPSAVPTTARPDHQLSDPQQHQHEQQHGAVVDSHWTQGDVVSQLRNGEIPTFTWPHCEGVDVSTGAGVAPVDKAPLKAARAGLRSVPAVWAALAAMCPNNCMLVDPAHAVPGPAKGARQGLALSFQQVNTLVGQAAAGLHAFGLRKGDHMALFSENSARWLLMEQGCALNGLPTAVRGAAAPVDELQYIFDHSDAKAVVLQDVALLKRLREAGWLASTAHGAPRLVVLIRPPEGGQEELSSLSSELGVPVVSVEEVMALGAKHRPHYRAPDLQPHDLLTLVYTSGTTGMPKGVMLSHGNVLHQVNHISLDDSDRRNPGAGDVVLSLLPCWHVFERSAELFALSRGASLVYSNVRVFKNDLQTYKPHFLIVVPRLLENVHKSIKDKFAAGPPARRRLVAMLSAVCVLYHKALKRAKGLVVRRRFLKLKHNPAARLLSLLTLPLLWPLATLADLLVWRKVRAALGGRQKLIVTGGSALPKFLERFYEAAGIPVVSGYGLSETSPVIAVRRADRNLVDGGVVGLPPKEVELQIRDPDTGAALPPGRPGIVFTRGPQVMLGYYKDGAATAKVLDAQGGGWFNTGDLGFINPGSGDLVLTGRAKDVIVLSNGENVEPQPIEDAILERAPLVEQVMCVGQDQRFLGAVAVVSPKALAERGLLSQAEAERLDAMVGPTAVLTGCNATPQELAAEAARLNADPAIVGAVASEVAAALSPDAEESQGEDDVVFRPWEQVKGVYLLLEPFTVANGLLTQTLKIRRNVVADRYAKEVEGIYN